jgi:hypothetical protein
MSNIVMSFHRPKTKILKVRWVSTGNTPNFDKKSKDDTLDCNIKLDEI